DARSGDFRRFFRRLRALLSRSDRSLHVGGSAFGGLPHVAELSFTDFPQRERGPPKPDGGDCQNYGERRDHRLARLREEGRTRTKRGENRTVEDTAVSCGIWLVAAVEA